MSKVSRSKAFVQELKWDLTPGLTDEVQVPSSDKKTIRRLEKLGAEIEAAGGEFSRVSNGGVSTFTYKPV